MNHNGESSVSDQRSLDGRLNADDFISKRPRRTARQHPSFARRQDIAFAVDNDRDGRRISIGKTDCALTSRGLGRRIRGDVRLI